jgi:hypothetical protein
MTPHGSRRVPDDGFLSVDDLAHDAAMSPSSSPSKPPRRSPSPPALTLSSLNASTQFRARARATSTSGFDLAPFRALVASLDTAVADDGEGEEQGEPKDVNKERKEVTNALRLLVEQVDGVVRC